MLTNEVRGYMGAKADRAFAIHSRGQKLQWGTVKEGPVRFWQASPRGETSTRTLADGTAFAVDFSRSCGANLMLVTTGKADGQTVSLGDTELTFFFPGLDNPPAIFVEGRTAIIGRQRVTLADGKPTVSLPTRLRLSRWLNLARIGEMPPITLNGQAFVPK